MRAVHKCCLGQEEPERRIGLDSFATAAMTTGFGFSGFGLPLADMGWQVRGGAVAIRVMPCLFVTFGLAKLMVAWRYRRHA